MEENKSLFDQYANYNENLENLINIINNEMEEDFYTVESFAWKMVVDDDNIEVLSSALKTLSDIPDTEENPKTFVFEIYSMLFCEMIFNMMNINFQCENKNSDEVFYPNYKNTDINDILDLLKNKFSKLNIQLKISEEHIEFKESVNIYVRQNYPDRYTRIALMGNKYDRAFTEKKKYLSTDKSKFYINLLNNDFDINIKEKKNDPINDPIEKNTGK